ncbi:uncharacterized protein N7500_002080 [Penicillium coprophilum]|uniref:uncharacterized protein n=1 Tax=Penicillium coprophilum TaxID=36646 RepID=UPI0023A669B8|nr:uncharacterized protein N7500_002080 [Penicillium coprophilum]KAJ5169297.1 hypothetical protein N7500_002080 [Penicillium coprophilum]
MRVLNLGVLINLAISINGLTVGRIIQARGPVPSSSPTGDAWRTMQCSQIHGDPATQWQEAGAKSAWDATIAAWKEQSNTHGFPQFFSNYTHGPQGMRCNDIVSDNRCSQPVECTDDTIPAGALILNGFAGVHQLHASVFQAIGLAQASVTNNVGTFASAFAPQPKDNGNMIKMIIDSAMIVVSLGVSLLYNVFLQAMENVIARAIAADMTGTILATSVSYYKTNMKGAIEGLGVQNTIDSFVGVTMTSWKNMETSYLDSIFAGTSDSGLEALYATINNGTIAAAMDRLDLAHTNTDVEKILYGQMISYAWSVSPDKARPFIWQSQDACDNETKTIPESAGVFVPNTVSALINVCYKGKMHYLLNAHQKSGTGFPATALPGGTRDTLDGKQFGGITIEDIVISSIDGWSNNNQTNGYPRANIDGIVASFGGDIVPSVRTPGFFSLPVCINGGVASQNIVYNRDTGSPYFPCENPEGYTSTGTNIHVSRGCIVINDAKRCQTWGGAYNVADQNTANSTATIYAMFDGDNELDQVTPGCKIMATWPRDYGDLDFSDNCLKDRSGLYSQCCDTDTPNTDVVSNPYSHSPR